MLHRVIIRQSPADPRPWDASFADAPHEAYGGGWPTAAVRRLIAACPERQIDADTLAGDYATCVPGRMAFTVEGADVVTNGAQLRAAFARFCGCISQDAGRSSLR